MTENPIASIVKAMQTEGAKFNPPTLCIGKVIQAEPLQIQIGDLILEREDVFISDMLLGAYSRNVKLTLQGTCYVNGSLHSNTESASGGSGDSSFESHSHGINTNAILEGSTNLEAEGVITLNEYIKNDDLIALIPTENNQVYVALCKVV